MLPRHFTSTPWHFTAPMHPSLRRSVRTLVGSLLGPPAQCRRLSVPPLQPVSASGASGSPHAVRALELFLPSASPEATAAVGAFLLAEREQTLDEFLLETLRRPDGSAFATEWRAFATAAQTKDRSRVAERAWNQWKAFPSATELKMVLPDACAVDQVTKMGVVRLPAVLSPGTASALRAHVLAVKDESEHQSADDEALRAKLFSRVLCPKAPGSDQPTTRWDVRLPWDCLVKRAVAEALRGELGDAFSQLAGGDDAQLWECSAIIAAKGCAPQILHGDTVFTDSPQVFTALVALQNIQPHMGATRFVPRTMSGVRGEKAHELLEQDRDGDGKNGYASRVSSVIAALREGEAVLYDSRTLHCGGPHQPAPEEPPERVVLVLSFRHVSADESLSNTDMHGAGSVLPEIAAMQLTLGPLRR